MKRVRRLVAAFSTVGLALGGVVVTAGPAAATHVDCGDVITTSTTLDRDVGPCPRNGLVVRGSGITLNLNGHRVFGSTPNGPKEGVGIRLLGVTGSTVQNGTVERFDAGVAIEGGSGNLIRKLTVRDNINDFSEDNPATPQDEGCIYGDGITTFNSDSNKITENQVVHNGPYSGISLVGDSDKNVVVLNLVSNNNVPNAPNAVDPSSTGPCGEPFARRNQDIGVRIEGPGANGNRVRGNTVELSLLDGIGIHGHVCNPPDPDGDGPQPPPPPQPANTDNVVSANLVRQNGAAVATDLASGIGILRQGPADVVCVAFRNTIIGNTSTENGTDGIFVGAAASSGTKDNVINRNVVRGNLRDGIRLAEGAVDNTIADNQGQDNVEFDGADFNLNCDNNSWVNNVFTKVNQPCVGGGGAAPAAPSSGSVDPAPLGLSNHVTP